MLNSSPILTATQPIHVLTAPVMLVTAVKSLGRSMLLCVND